jgi:hypothetical protein
VAAEIAIVDVEALDPGEMLAGLRVQVRPLGAVQESEICPLNPPDAVALIMRLVEPPGTTIALMGERLNEKSPVTTGAMLAKKAVELPPGGKLGWLSPPAVR